MKIFYLIILNFLLTFPLQSQVSVDQSTGRLYTSVPLYNLSLDGKNFPVALNYGTGGVRVGEYGGWLGVGWSFTLDGSISRVVRDLPDDYSDKGWLKGSTATDINAFIDNSNGNCSLEPSAWADLEAFRYKDTRPDEFSINFGPISARFVFDENGVVQIYPYRDIEVAGSFDAVTGELSGFEVKDNEGYTYIFDITSRAKKTVESPGAYNQKFYQREFDLYENEVDYNSLWHLTKIISPSGNYLQFNYTNYTSLFNTLGTTNNLDLYVKQDTGYIEVKSQLVRHAYFQKGLNEVFVATRDNQVTTSLKFHTTGNRGHIKEIDDNFNFYNKPFLAGSRLDKMEVFTHSFSDSKELLKTIDFNYYDHVTNNSTHEGVKNLFLKSVTERAGCLATPPYTFDYHFLDISFVRGGEVDYWGYYNRNREDTLGLPEIYIYPDNAHGRQYSIYEDPTYTGQFVLQPGTDRKPHEQYVKYGSLRGIEGPAGGYTLVEYEPNSYYDAVAGIDRVAGGIRVSKIIHLPERVGAILPYIDGPYPSKEYKYELENGFSSGKINQLPQFSIPTSYYEDPANGEEKTFSALAAEYPLHEVWDYLTVRSANDLSEDGSYVLYGQVKEILGGSGYIKSYYDIPTSFEITSVSDWTANKTNYINPGHLSGSSACIERGIVPEAEHYAFPYISQPNFGFETALLTRIEAYDIDNRLITETDYEYSRLNEGAKNIVKGFHLQRLPVLESENLDPVLGITEYYKIANVSKVMASSTTKAYDDLHNGNFTETSSSWTYSPTHLYLSKVNTTKNNETHTEEYYYPMDFSGATNSNDIHESALYFMNQNRIKLPIVESLRKMQYADGTQKLLNGNLTLYTAEGGRVLPKKMLSLKKPKDPSQFSYANPGPGGFSYDNDYDLLTVVNGYENNRPVSVTDNAYQRASSHYGFNGTRVIAVIKDAPAGLVRYSPFDTENTFGFDIINNGQAITYENGFMGQKSLKLNPVYLTANYEKGEEGTLYMFSGYVKAASAGDLLLKIKDQASNVVGTISLPFTGTGIWQEVKGELALDGYPLQLQLEVTTSVEANIDEVLFYPSYASVVNTAYDLHGRPVAMRNTNGQLSYTEYDPLGRVLAVRDKDKNIIKAYSYNNANDKKVVSAEFQNSGSPIVDTPVHFEAITETGCYNNLEYFWDFGTGEFVQGQELETHTFSETGTYTVRLKVKSSLFSEDQYTREVTVYSPSTTSVSLCASGVRVWDVCGQQAQALFTATYNIAECTMPAPPNSCETLFQVQLPAGSSSIEYEYSWYTRPIGGGDDWSVVISTVDGTSPSPDTMTLNFADQYNFQGSGYEIRALVSLKDGSGPVMRSNIVTVEAVNENTCVPSILNCQ